MSLKIAPERVHMLSKKSRDLARDTFIFQPSPVRLWCGLNQNLSPVTSNIFQRWMRLINPNLPPFELCPITLQKYGVLHYSASPSGEPIPPQSTKRLPPGDYAWVSPNPNFMEPFTLVFFYHSYAAMKRQSEETDWPVSKEYLSQYDIAPAIETSVIMRDNRCFITGSTSETTELEVTWIVPPVWNFDTARTCVPESDQDHSSHIVPANAVLMRKDLIPAFQDNAFGVDVDDNYRIVAFRDFGLNASLIPVGSLAPSRQAEHPQPGPGAEFLREHFRKCLTVHLPGGDIWDDYSLGEVQATFREVGLSDSDDEVEPMDSPKWKTVLGNEIREWYLRSVVDPNHLESDDLPEA
ncbi:hypothetical protein Hypma_001762 [Hypsizygus marmoreus]|uniref:HNH nuclease domain-containing protein n=1 Tax=Hypsizygus marmoreus TaxID=39966 RepID=A0A369J9E9_HYPMA|nr:hypothetical protein Hypma_001762 [Hypsizygus marmoreus]